MIISSRNITNVWVMDGRNSFMHYMGFDDTNSKLVDTGASKIPVRLRNLHITKVQLYSK